MAKLTRNSSVKIALIVVLGALALALLGFGTTGGCSARFGGWAGTTQLGNATVDAASVKNLDISWSAGSVDVKVVDDDETGGTVQLVETAPRGLTKAQQMRWGMDGSTLEVDYGSGFSCFGMGRKDLEVRVPKSCAERLGWVDIDGSSGTYDVSGLSAETLELNLASGEMDVVDVRAKQLSVDVASGEVHVTGSFEDQVSLETASGSTRVACEGTCPRTVYASVASGSTTVALPRDSEFSVSMEKASGSFSNEFGESVVGNGSTTIDAFVASGEFRLEKL